MKPHIGSEVNFYRVEVGSIYGMLKSSCGFGKFLKSRSSENKISGILRPSQYVIMSQLRPFCVVIVLRSQLNLDLLLDKQGFDLFRL